ncbi:pyrroline-5-carboxylate reductase [Thermosynechococcus sp.]|uniref:pyrroline-5-carboxylate reductase n=1 Tax=Thermosynechococcus sp. TaxID=2814275 RepID=UPI00262F5260|nr:pyrroline-5-carboxylate reductase [Thermosynechococcus sp.]
MPNNSVVLRVPALGIIGCGRMAEAMLSRLLANGLLPDHVWVSVRSPQRQQYLADTYGVRVTTNPEVATAETLLLAVKPQVFAEIESELADTPVAQERGVVLSIMAGIHSGRLRRLFPQRLIFRAMPNTPAQVGAGVIALASDGAASELAVQKIQHLLGVLGQVVAVSEGQMDAVTALSGSGPAFVALIVEALCDAGVAVGLSRSLTQELVYGTIAGTVQLLKERGLHPAQLKDAVTSPAGTTIAGLEVLEAAGMRGTLMQTVKAAYERSQALN